MRSYVHGKAHAERRWRSRGGREALRSTPGDLGVATGRGLLASDPEVVVGQARDDTAASGAGAWGLEGVRGGRRWGGPHPRSGRSQKKAGSRVSFRPTV